MNLFILDYVPNDETAFIVADAFVEARVRDLYEQFLQDDDDCVIRVASELAIDTVRVLVKEGVFEKASVRIRFNGVDQTVDVNGALMEWPNGLCDYKDNIVDRLIDWE